jgi:hypothetical protein
MQEKFRFGSRLTLQSSSFADWLNKRGWNCRGDCSKHAGETRISYCGTGSHKSHIAVRALSLGGHHIND